MIIHILTLAFGIVSSVLIFFLLFPFLTVLLSLGRKEKIIIPAQPKLYDFGCIITAYRNAQIARPLVESLLRQQHQNFLIYLVADNCDISDWDLDDPRLFVLLPREPLNLKAKSIMHAMDRYQRPHEYTVVFDGDNLAHPEFLMEINRYANFGYKSIQGQRTAKNLDTLYACADSLGEFYKNYVERYVPYMIGSSTVISGSGMAVETELYRDYLNSKEIQEGQHLWKKMLQEDKILQNHILRKNGKICYAKNALVFDEKVTTAQAVETQRARWLFSYFQNLPNSSGLLLRGLFGFRWNQFLFGLITIAPPLFILVFFSGVCFLLGWFVQPLFSWLLLASGIVFVLTILWTLRLSNAPKEIWSALGGLPLFIFKQVTALGKMRDPNKNFKHSEHTVTVKIDDVLKQ
jgi:cellulose synthase/poly-beta-1,6-N-acetylglucosamine synthase-like glycosyltransferase